MNGRLAFGRFLGLPLVILALFGCCVYVQPAMASLNNLLNLLSQTSLLFMLACAQLLVLVTRGFDLSAGANVSLVSVVSCMVMVAFADSGDAAVFIGCLAGLAAGGIIGAANGFLVAVLEINPFVVTLGTLSIAGGIATTISNGFPIFKVPAAFPYFFNQSIWLFLPAPVMAACLLAGAIHFLLSNTVHGRTLYLLGDNASAALLAGRNVKFHLFFAYLSSGIVAALAGLMMTAQTGSGEPNLGTNLVLNSIAAAVLGGASLRGGVGGVTAPLLGAALITVLSVGMNLTQVDGSLQSVIVGAVVVLAAFVAPLKAKFAS
jgi:ribose transport system permease protein